MTSYTIIKKNGEEIEFSSELDLDQSAAVIKSDLMACRLAGRRTNDFASDLLVAFEENRISRNQGLWLMKLAAEVQAAAAEPAEGPYLSIVQAMQRMQEGAKRRVIVRLANNVSVKACSEGGNAGGCYVFRFGDYVGKILPTGQARIMVNEVREVLNTAAPDLEGAARDYGRETGSCSCCGRPLADPVSVFGGIGPVCLEKLAGAAARKQLEVAYAESQRLVVAV
jgi:hypothetical protein